MKSRVLSSALAFCAFLRIESAAAAQPAPETDAGAEDRAVTAVFPSPDSVTPSSASQAGSVWAELGGGVAGMTLGLGIASWYAWSNDVSLHDQSFNPALLGLMGISAATVLVAVPLGVTLGGNATGGRGTYWGALGGVAVGALASSLFQGLLLATDPSDPLFVAGGCVGLAIPILGAVLGYRLSANDAGPAEPLRATPLASIHPSVAFDPRTRTGSLVFSGAF